MPAHAAHPIQLTTEVKTSAADNKTQTDPTLHTQQ